MPPEYTLYYTPSTCATAVHIVLNAVGADYTLVRLEGDANRSQDYRLLNPLGQVPTLLENGEVLRESAALMIYLLDKFRHPLLPPGGPERRKALQWLLFFNSTMHQTHGAYFLIEKNITDSVITEPVRELLSKRISKLWRYVEAEIKSEYICGATPSAADILMAVIANWRSVIHPMPSIGEKTKAICLKVAELPYVAKALKEEEIQFRF